MTTRLVICDLVEIAAVSVKIFPAFLQEAGFVSVVVALVVGVVGTGVRLLVMPRRGANAVPQTPSRQASPTERPSGR